MASKKQDANVTSIHRDVEEPPDPPTEKRVVRWVVPHVASFPPMQHAHFLTPTPVMRSVCLDMPIEGAIHPPAPETMRCPRCVAALRALEEGHHAGAE